MQASEFVAKNYYHQDPRLLRFVLSKPPDRVKYTNLLPLRKDFEEIQALGVESGIMRGTIQFEDYVDASFVKDLQHEAEPSAASDGAVASGVGSRRMRFAGDVEAGPDLPAAGSPGVGADFPGAARAAPARGRGGPRSALNLLAYRPITHCRTATTGSDAIEARTLGSPPHLGPRSRTNARA